MVHIPGRVFLQTQLGHLVHNLGVEETLLAGLGLAGADFKRCNGLGVCGICIDG
jgi:hypothetical protein